MATACDHSYLTPTTTLVIIDNPNINTAIAKAHEKLEKSLQEVLAEQMATYGANRQADPQIRARKLYEWAIKRENCEIIENGCGTKMIELDMLLQSVSSRYELRGRDIEGMKMCQLLRVIAKKCQKSKNSFIICGQTPCISLSEICKILTSVCTSPQFDEFIKRTVVRTCCIFKGIRKRLISTSFGSNHCKRLRPANSGSVAKKDADSHSPSTHRTSSAGSPQASQSSRTRRTTLEYPPTEVCESLSYYRLFDKTSHTRCPCNCTDRKEVSPVQTVIRNIEVVPSEGSICQYKILCKRYLDSINIAAVYFDSRYDVCYCTTCLGHRDEKPYYYRGEPPKPYAVPAGWSKFGLVMGPQAEKFDVFNKWHIGFHGTLAKNVGSILDSRDLLMPGDVVMGGRVLRPPKGHYTDDRKPEGFDIRQVFVSPTIKYAGLPVYAKQQRWQDPDSGRLYDTRVVFLLRIRPGSYSVGPETVLKSGLKEIQIDPYFRNEELEWSTKERGATIPVGLMIKVEEVVYN